MFKNATIYRITPDWVAGTPYIEESLAKAPFSECGQTKQDSSGWIPPRAGNGALAESIDGQLFLTLRTDTRKVPADALDKRVEEICNKVEQETGRKPGKKHRKELKEQALIELLPQAFIKTSETMVWIDRKNCLLVIDTANQSRADFVSSMLVRSLDGMTLSFLCTEKSPSATMTGWLHEGAADTPFQLGRELELHACDESKAVVRYTNHNLDTDEVKHHIVAGKAPTKLALTWDGRVSFVLTESGQLRKLALLDVAMESRSSDHNADAFDADAVLFTGEMRKLIPDLIEALGGEQRLGAA